jgi:hypothetical protein
LFDYIEVFYTGGPATPHYTTRVGTASRGLALEAKTGSLMMPSVSGKHNQAQVSKYATYVPHERDQ